MKILFCRADHDLPTKYLATYTRLLVEEAVKQGHAVVNLYGDGGEGTDGPAATLEFEKQMDANPDAIIIAGHGNSDLITGQDLQVLMKVGVNDDLMSGKKAFFASCLTGQRLGPSMVDKNCPEFYGYVADFVFNYHPEYEAKPLDDPWAKAQFDSAMITGYGLLAGLGPKEIYESTIERYSYWWDWWLKQNDPMADEIVTWINWNRSNFIAITPSGLYYEEKPKLTLQNFALPVGVATLLFLLSHT